MKRADCREKQVHATVVLAWREISRLRSRPDKAGTDLLRPYWCRRCRGFHVGRQNPKADREARATGGRR